MASVTKHPSQTFKSFRGHKGKIVGYHYQIGEGGGNLEKKILAFFNPPISITTSSTEILVSSVLKSKGGWSDAASTSARDYTALSCSRGNRLPLLTTASWSSRGAWFRIYWAHTHHFELHAAHKTRRCIWVGRSWKEGVLARGLPVLKM